MIIKAYNSLLTVSATSMVLVVFCIKEEYVLKCLVDCPNSVSYILFILIPVILTALSLTLSKFLGNGCLEYAPLSIELSDNAFLSSYLGYFFVALSIPNIETLVCIYTIILIFTYHSRTIYFNPIFLIFGYHFYSVTTSENIKIFVITKRAIKVGNDLVDKKMKRINNFTFIEQNKKKDGQ